MIERYLFVVERIRELKTKPQEQRSFAKDLGVFDYIEKCERIGEFVISDFLADPAPRLDLPFAAEAFDGVVFVDDL